LKWEKIFTNDFATTELLVKNGIFLLQYGAIDEVMKEMPDGVKLTRIDEDGKILWTAGLSARTYNDAVAAFDNDGIVIAFTENADSSNFYKREVSDSQYCSILKIDFDGKIKWKKQFHAQNCTRPSALLVSGNNYVLAGYTGFYSSSYSGNWMCGSSHGNFYDTVDGFVLRIDKNGNFIKTSCIPHDDLPLFKYPQMQFLPDGSLFIGNEREKNEVSYDFTIFLAKTKRIALAD
ncbi:MAG: hypothetical protein IAF38_04540, partial [Bacteroidia bacterium]|nr:hypothetical protein [Bacteroidia bacterium]